MKITLSEEERKKRKETEQNACVIGTPEWEGRKSKKEYLQKLKVSCLDKRYKMQKIGEKQRHPH
jgi:hypothetical protein